MLEIFRRVACKVRDFLKQPILDALKSAPTGPDTAAQIQLQIAYRRLRDEGKLLPSIDDIGFKSYSQMDEDGILLYLFSLLGTSNKLSVEVCAGEGIECNTANLILNHGWHGFLVDGNESNVKRGKKFYAQSPQTYVFPPCFVHLWITRQGINELLSTHGFVGEIDLLSLDLDGMDYWIWEALEVVQPRVVVLEYCDILGPDRNWTVPYSDDFSCNDYPSTDGAPNYAGASLGAFVKLGRRKGYRLVGINRCGYNAFFVKNGIGENLLPEIPVSSCFGHPKVVAGMRDRFPAVKDLPWVEV